MDPHERNYVEITKEDIQRMRGQRSRNCSEKLLKEKLKLKALSEERAERWPNTIKALREKRLLAKEEELQKLEEERLKLDATEVAYKAEQRKLQIERANKMLLHPLMKEALSKTLLNDVLHERSAQIQYKEKVQQDWKKKDEKWLELERRQILEQTKEEKLKLEKEKVAKLLVQDEQLKQIEEHNLKLVQVKEQKELEKETLQKQKEELHHEIERNEEKRKKKIMETKNMLYEAKKAHMEKRDEETENLMEMEKKITEYAANREKTLEARKAAANAKAALKEKQTDALIRRLSESKSRGDDEQKLLMEQKKKEMEEDRKENMRAEKERNAWEACDRSRKKQIQTKKMQAEAEMEQDKYEAEKSWQRCWEIREENGAEGIDKFIQNRSVASHHLKAMVKKVERDKEERKEILQEEKDMIKRLNENDLNEFPLERLLI